MPNSLLAKGFAKILLDILNRRENCTGCPIKSVSRFKRRVLEKKYYKKKSLKNIFRFWKPSLIQKRNKLL